MSLSHRYQDFGPIGIDPGALMAIPEEGLEDLKLRSFEDGYKAGWEDSTKAYASDQDRAVVAIAQRLEDLSFTHAEAVIKMTSAMQPLLQKITTHLLPETARASLGAHVVEQLNLLLKENAQDAIEVAVAPQNLESLQTLLEGHTKAALTFCAEPMLTPGQVYLRASRTEREINLDVVQAGIRSALDAFFAQTQAEDQRHG